MIRSSFYVVCPSAVRGPYRRDRARELARQWDAVEETWGCGPHRVVRVGPVRRLVRWAARRVAAALQELAEIR